MKKVITYGTFDLFHVGHLRLIKRAKDLGDHLIVAVSTDEFNQIKDKETVIPYNERKKIVKSIEHVDQVIPEENWQQKPDDIKRYEVDIFTMGSDWEGEFDQLEKYCEIVYLPRTEGISTTDIRKRILRDKQYP